MIFSNCILVSWKSKAVVATSDLVIIENSTLKEPGRDSLMGFVGIDANSQFRMSNVHIVEPSQGTLLTHFSSSKFKSITIDLCKCGIKSTLVEGADNFLTNHRHG